MDASMTTRARGRARERSLHVRAARPWRALAAVAALIAMWFVATVAIIAEHEAMRPEAPAPAGGLACEDGATASPTQLAGRGPR